MSVPIRLRGPQGITTIQASLDGPVSDLLQAIFAATEACPHNKRLCLTLIFRHADSTIYAGSSVFALPIRPI